MLDLTLATLRSQSRRYLAPGLAILLGVAFVAATLCLGKTMSASTMSALTGDLKNYAAVVVPGKDSAENVIPAAALDTVRGTPGVQDVRAERTGYGRLAGKAGGSFVLLASSPSPTSRATTSAGRLPQRPAEIALSRTVAASAGLTVGDVATITPEQSDDAGRAPAGAASRAEVVGIVDAAKDPRYAGGSPLVFATADQVATWTGQHGYTELDVVAAPGTTPEQLRAALADRVGPGSTVRTGAEQAQAAVTTVTGGTDFTTILLLGFAAIALFVSALVMANAFTILLARRSRETALLRCVGATRTQVLRSALAESAVLGVIASAVGVLTGVVLARALVFAGNRLEIGVLLTDFSVPWTAVALPMVVGLVVTVAATLLPIARSARVTPLPALQPALAVRARSRAGLVRIVLGLVLVAAGAGMLALGVTAPSLPVAMLGGAASFLGVLLAGGVLVPAVARLVGALPARVAGVPGQLAVDNAVRHPARAAATTSALLIGVTLISMMIVGTATGKTSVDRELDRQFAIDAAVSSSAANLPRSSVAALADGPGVVASAALKGATLTVAGARDQEVVGIPASAAGVVHDASRLAALRPGTIIVSADTAAAHDLRNGSAVTLRGAAGQATLHARVEDSFGQPWAVTESDLQRLAPEAGVRSVLLRFAPGADLADALDGVRAAVASVPDVTVGGSAPQREQITRALDIMLAVVTALLAVSVLIAVVGIGNALSLSVLERSRESALLRALGLTRGQLRATLAIEAGVLALVATVLGTVLGVVYGWLGPMSVLGSEMQITLGLPWQRLLMVAAGALVAGLLASVLPARRAARTAPAAALAAD